MTEIHDKVRRRAFEIWEAEGRPEGRDVEHWLRAEAECTADTAKAAKPRKAAAERKAAPKAAAPEPKTTTKTTNTVKPAKPAAAAKTAKPAKAPAKA